MALNNPYMYAYKFLKQQMSKFLTSNLIKSDYYYFL